MHCSWLANQVGIPNAARFVAAPAEIGAAVWVWLATDVRLCELLTCLNEESDGSVVPKKLENRSDSLDDVLAAVAAGHQMVDRAGVLET